MDFHREHGLEVRVARIFNTYGPRMAFDDGRVVSNFIIQALRGDDITIYGDGSQTRSFCYVDDLVAGIMALMEHPSETGPVNLGNPGEFTVRELAEKVLELTGSRSRIVCRPLPPDDPRQRRPVIDRAKQALGWTPKTPLEEGLKRTITEFRARLDLLARKPSAELQVSQ
jgi:UDP-glucuronate decarboxylase